LGTLLPDALAIRKPPQTNVLWEQSIISQFKGKAFLPPAVHNASKTEGPPHPEEGTMTTPTPAKGYLVAVLAAAGTLLLRLAVDPFLDGHPSLALPLVGVLIASWYGGVKAGLLAVVLSIAGVLVVFPSVGLHTSGSQWPVALAVYAAVACVAAVLIARLRSVTSELKQTTERVERISELLLAAQRASQSGVWAWEPDTGHVFWCREHFYLYGLQATDCISVKRWIQAIHPDDRSAVAAVLEACARTPQRIDVQFRIQRETGAIWCRLVGDIIGQDPVRMAGITINITQYKMTELELKRSNEDLDSFAYVVSHDLKEPIRMVTAYAQLIQRHYGPALGEDGGQFLQTVLSGAARMQQLVDALLTLSRPGSRGAEQNGSVDLNSVMNSAVASLQRVAETTGASITWNHLPAVPGNDVVLRQIFQNLIENALKYRQEKVSPRIHIEAHRRDGCWRIDVRDNGIGFEMKYANNLFIPFRRLHAAHQFEGTGIGLATCKRSIERLGGSIEAHSELGRGSVFTIVLPALGNKSAETPER
jgi:signal transduction histidine kinase